MTHALALRDVRADKDGRTLHLTYADGVALAVDLRPVIQRHPTLSPEAAVFRQAEPGPWGGTVTWGSDLSLDSAARALGLSRRMLACYRSREREIPLPMNLACTGWEVRHQRLAA